MENEDIVRELAEQGERIKVANKRIADLEEQQQRIQDLTLSVQELAISVRNMVEVQKEHSDKLAELEARPAQNWNTMTRTAFTTIISAIAGALALALVNSVAHVM